MRILGVDGGQSSTRCLAVDEDGRILGYGTAGPSNHAQGEAGRRRLRSALRDSICQALASDTLESVDSIVLGMTGIGRTLGQPALVESFVREFVLPRAIAVYNDLKIALMGASVGEPGIVVYAGTGAHTFGVNERGDEVRVGGWGHIIDDEGAGYDLGRRALQSVFRAEDGREPPTVLRARLLTHFHCDSLSELRNRIYEDQGLDRSEIATLSKLVGEAAAEGDGVAEAILQRAGETLAKTAVVALQKLEQKGKPVVYYAGGVFRSGVLLDAFTWSLTSQTSDVDVHPPRFPPVVGAILLGFRLLGLEPGAPILEALAQGISHIGWAS